MQNEQATIIRLASNEAEAKRLAEEAYDHFLQTLDPVWVVSKKDVIVLRELYVDQGLVGYLIRVDMVDAMNFAVDAGQEVSNAS